MPLRASLLGLPLLLLALVPARAQAMTVLAADLQDLAGDSHTIVRGVFADRDTAALWRGWG